MPAREHNIKRTHSVVVFTTREAKEARISACEMVIKLNAVLECCLLLWNVFSEDRMCSLGNFIDKVNTWCFVGTNLVFCR